MKILNTSSVSENLLNASFTSFSLQKASTTSTAVVSDYVGYLEKGQIPPKVLKDDHNDD